MCRTIKIVPMAVQVKDRVFIGPNIRFGEVTVPAQDLKSGERYVGNSLPLVKKKRQHYSNGRLEFELLMMPVDFATAERLPPSVPHCYFSAHTDCRCVCISCVSCLFCDLHPLLKSVYTSV